MKPDCIIAAREGSKRIKNKNIVIFKNKPLIYYGIKTAIKSRIFENVYVYTDSKKIAKIAVRYGAKVPFMRPKYLSDDKTGLKEVIVNFLGKINVKKKVYAFIYATAYNLKPKEIILAYKKLKKNKKDMIIGIKEFESSPLRSFNIKNENLRYNNKKFARKNTNNLKKFYFHPGSFFLFNAKKYIKSKGNITNNTGYFLHKKFDIFDIDEIEDLHFIKKYFK